MPPTIPLCGRSWTWHGDGRERIRGLSHKADIIWIFVGRVFFAMSCKLEACSILSHFAQIKKGSPTMAWWQIAQKTASPSHTHKLLFLDYSWQWMIMEQLLNKCVGDMKCMLNHQQYFIMACMVINRNCPHWVQVFVSLAQDVQIACW